MTSMSSLSLAEILRSQVTLELEGIDRMYLNVCVPNLQYPSGVAIFLRQHRGAQYASSVLLQPISDAFVSKMDAFTTTRQIPVVTFRKGQRKDDLAKQALAEKLPYVAEWGSRSSALISREADPSVTSRYGERDGIRARLRLRSPRIVARTPPTVQPQSPAPPCLRHSSLRHQR